MPCWSHRSETGTCSRRWSRRMATFSWAVNRLRVCLGMGEPPLEIVAYSSGPFFPFQLKQNSSGVRAAVGWNDDREIVVAGPRPQRADSRRFLAARGLYHALFACDRSERLVTDASTWDQHVSRAFAAEFLAPHAALTARTGSRTDRSQVEELASDFGASMMVI